MFHVPQSVPSVAPSLSSQDSILSMPHSLLLPPSTPPPQPTSLPVHVFTYPHVAPLTPVPTTPMDKGALAPPSTPVAGFPPSTPLHPQSLHFYQPQAPYNVDNHGLYCIQPHQINGALPPDMMRTYHTAAPLKPVMQVSGNGPYYYPPDAQLIHPSFDPYAVGPGERPASVEALVSMTTSYMGHPPAAPLHAQPTPTLVHNNSTANDTLQQPASRERRRNFVQMNEKRNWSNRQESKWREEESEIDEEAREKRRQESFKTSLCDAWRRGLPCSYGEDCRFAHGEEELRVPPPARGITHPKYKTQLCDKFSLKGSCPYGSRCQFIHRMIKGLSVFEYNQQLAQGQISPARDGEIVNADEDWMRHRRSPDSSHVRSALFNNSRTVVEKLRERAEETSPTNPRLKTYLPEVAVIKIEGSGTDAHNGQQSAQPNNVSARRRLSDVQSSATPRHAANHRNGEHADKSSSTRKSSSSSPVPVCLLRLAEKKHSQDQLQQLQVPPTHVIVEEALRVARDRHQLSLIREERDDSSYDRSSQQQIGDLQFDFDKLAMINEDEEAITSLKKACDENPMGTKNVVGLENRYY